ncbi:MAG: lysine 2,3-aminomutase [Candidatus Cloacimonetes bacterium]|nr:lysine 2,3-aminomutase [Candidatus Cloacimonadota bacterium]
MKYKAYTLENFREIRQINQLEEELLFDIEVVAHVLPFKVNNYVVDELIDWSDPVNDPIFRMTFPQRDMLKPEHYAAIAVLIKSGADRGIVRQEANRIRLQLNPHPAKQLEKNIPVLEGVKLRGLQHKYRETLLFFPIKGQTCHAYCTFCFRWPQFVGMNKLKIAMSRSEELIEYLKRHSEITDLLITGGDPLIMKTRFIRMIFDKINSANLRNLINIRIGSKALSYWPYRFLEDDDAEDLLELFREVNQKGRRLAFMAHFNHQKELNTKSAREAVKRILSTGSIIRSQAPILRNINDKPAIWQKMWKKQVRMGIIPYYMFVPRNTGAQHYFATPLVKIWEIFKEAYQQVSGLCRTVRGPIMSADPGKIQILGVDQVKGEKVIALQFIQGRNPDWVMRPFFARYDEKAVWRTQLVPAFDRDKFFYEEDLSNG